MPAATPISELAFSKLTAPEAINARTSTKDGLDELAASIKAKGVIQPLAVRPADGGSGRYEIIDGRRRFLALQMLVKSRAMSKSDMVPVIVRNEDDAEALETSMIANTVRLPMHPVDQHGVFARLQGQGRTVAEIAERFGLAERTIRQRLALGQLAPAILDAWRKGKIEQKIAEAFTIEPRHDVQEAIWNKVRKQAAYGLSEWQVKQELSGERPSAKNVKPGLLDAYLAAGGTITESLFEDDRLIDDAGLFKKIRADIAAARFAALRESVKAEGWAWVALASEGPRGAHHTWDNVLGEAEDENPELTPDEEGRIATFEADHMWSEVAAIRVSANLRRFTPEMKARSGVIIDDGYHDDDPEIYRGLLKPSAQADLEDSISRGGTNTSQSSGDDGEEEEMAGTGEATGTRVDDGDDGATAISSALIQTLTEAQTAAAMTVLENEPRIALAAAVAALRTRWSSPVKLSASGQKKINADCDFDEEFAKCLGESNADVASAFAHLISHALDLVAFNSQSDRSGPDALVAALPADAYLAAMRERFLPEDYFKRVTKALALEALDEMAEAGVVATAQVDALVDARKTDIAEVASSIARACGWLPEVLRHPGYRLEVAAA